MKINLRCAAGHCWTYEGLQGDFTGSNIQMQTNCPECDRMVSFTIRDGAVIDGPPEAAPRGQVPVRWPDAIRDRLGRRQP